MKGRSDHVARAVQAPTRRELVELLGQGASVLTLPEVARLTRRLEQLDEPTEPVRIGVVRTYTTELLRPYWTFEALLHGFAADLYEAPYGAVLQSLQPGSALAAHAPEVTYFFLRWEDIEPRFAHPGLGAAADRAAVAEAAIDALLSMLHAARRVLPGLLVVTMLPRMGGPELGLYDARVPTSEAGFRAELKGRTAGRLRDQAPSVVFDDLDALVEEIGRRTLFDPRLWYSARFPYSVAGAQAIVRRLMKYVLVLKQPRAKCVVVDADNTLWGGLVGEEGIDGIELGPEYPGSAYVAFQRRLLDIQQRGFLLALCSRNNEAEVRHVLADHPHQLLRESHFAALRVDWEPKPASLRSIAAQLNLGLEALVFVDDSAHECLAVRQSLPEVTVVHAPAEPAALASCLDDVARLEIVALTDEDRARTALYAQERQRRALASSSDDFDHYLASLDMTMTVGIDDARHVARIAQLTQKTNQFNLTTRRYDEAEIRRFMADPDWLVAHCSITDIFGDSGVVGVALVRGVSGATAEIDTFLLSCRVIGRRAETAFLRFLLDTLSQRGVADVRASYVPTAKNALVERFWPEHGFIGGNPGVFRLALAARGGGTSVPPPIRIREIAEPAAGDAA
jgi:FkbH-like protein